MFIKLPKVLQASHNQSNQGGRAGGIPICDSFHSFNGCASEASPLFISGKYVSNEESEQMERRRRNQTRERWWWRGNLRIRHKQGSVKTMRQLLSLSLSLYTCICIYKIFLFFFSFFYLYLLLSLFIIISIITKHSPRKFVSLSLSFLNTPTPASPNHQNLKKQQTSPSTQGPPQPPPGSWQPPPTVMAVVITTSRGRLMTALISHD